MTSGAGSLLAPPGGCLAVTGAKTRVTVRARSVGRKGGACRGIARQHGLSIGSSRYGG